MEKSTVRMLLLLLFLLLPVTSVLADVRPLLCSTSAYSECSAYLYVANSSLLPSQLANLFNSTVDEIGPFEGSSSDYLVSVDCSCYNFPEVSAFFALATYTVQNTDSGHGLAEILRDHFSNFAWVGNNPSSDIKQGQTIKIDLGCGCPPAGYSSVVSYAVQLGDTTFSIANKLKSDVDALQKLNDIQNISSIEANQVIFVPSTLAPRRPPLLSKSGATKKKHGLIWAVIGIVLASAIVICLIWVYRVHLKKKMYHKQSNIAGALPCLDLGPRKTARKGSLIAQTGKPGSSSKTFGFLMSWAPQFRRHGSSNNSVKHKITILRDSTAIFESEKPVVFSYKEIVEATGNFLETRKLGEGAFGSVFFGTLQDQDVAIKKMKASKSREFMAELKVLCKVHHANLVELIGYAVSEDDLFLVYEFVENGALSEHLHHPQEKGYLPLSWTARVQVALDAARGLEYIHDHTKAHYIHRDVKTSNILLDGLFRAKVADFGLAKLTEHAGDGGDMTTRVVGTFGYLAPEYMRDGYVTSKSDVYAFGVVLMELITGQEALTNRKKPETESADRRSLVSLILFLFQNGEPDIEVLRLYIDPNLENNFPPYAISEMLEIARSCVEEDPLSRPDMGEVVFKLSRILQSSIEWESTLAGNSQVFSGVFQGR